MKVLIDNGHGYTSHNGSPDGRLKEWEWTRQIAQRILSALLTRGIAAEIVVPEKADISLKERCRRVNTICNEHGAHNVILVSIHVDAAASDGKWHDAGGWSAYTTVGRTRSDELAEHLYNAAEACLSDYHRIMDEGKQVGTYSPKQRHIRMDKSDGDKDKEASFYILRNTKCAAVLTENLFQDNMADVNYLLSDKGKEDITMLHVNGILDYIQTKS